MNIVREENPKVVSVICVEVGKIFQRENGDILIKTPNVKGDIDSIEFNAMALSDTEKILQNIPSFEKVTIL